MGPDDKAADFEVAISQATGLSLTGPFAYGGALSRYSHAPQSHQSGLGRLVFEMRNGNPDAVNLLTRVLNHYLDQHPLLARPDLIVPIPDSVPNRIFHPVHSLAEKLSERFSGRLAENIISRAVIEKPQRDRSYAERIIDGRLLYKVEHPEVIVGKQILIFDDIYATGRSVSDAARVISECHPKVLMVLVMAWLIEAESLLP